MIILGAPIIYFFDGRSPSRPKQSFYILIGALMEHFLQGIALLRYWYVDPNEVNNWDLNFINIRY